MKSILDTSSTNVIKNSIYQLIKRCISPFMREQDMINKYLENENEKLRNELDNLRLQIKQLEEIDYKYLETMDYSKFENKFRGSREVIMKNQEIYLKYFKDRKNVLDLGCGRGEFVELLRDNGIGVTGYDINLKFVEQCSKRNLNVKIGDAIDVLSSIEGTVDGVFMAQVIEHMKITDVLRVMRLAYNKLEKGAYLIMETPNPKCIATMVNAFYLDPTHKRPVHPGLIEYFAQISGFSEVRILFTESSRSKALKLPHIDQENSEEFNLAVDSLNDLLYGSQDYALIAKR